MTFGRTLGRLGASIVHALRRKRPNDSLLLYYDEATAKDVAAWMDEMDADMQALAEQQAVWDRELLEDLGYIEIDLDEELGNGESE